MYKITFAILFPLFLCNPLLAGWLSGTALNHAYKKFLDPRNYREPMNEIEKEAIRYIVLTLGNEPLYKLPKYQGTLKKKGDKLKNVHPLNVWGEIFTSKDTISAIVNMRSRKLVWKPFLKEMSESLQEALLGENIKEEYIEDFSVKIGINQDIIKNFLIEGDWQSFIQALIDNAKKSSQDDRYY